MATRLCHPWIYAAYGVVWMPWPVGSTASCVPATSIRPVDRPVTLNVWEAVYFDHDLDRLVDAGGDRGRGSGSSATCWTTDGSASRRSDRAGLGDWTVSPEVWPDGLHPLVDKVLELGMQFGLWFEPEMVNLDSEVARAHPDWVMATGGRLPSSPAPSR